MDLRSAVGTAITVLLVLLAGTILVTQLFGFPAPISFVETDSMEPQLQPGDGFIGIPKPLAGEIQRGDVITYEAQTIGGGGLTTHRVVGETEAGYITKGDGNPFNDTTAGEPPVTESQIELVVIQINGEIVVIPNLGDITNAAQGLIGTVIGVLGLSNISAGNTGIIVVVVGVILIVGAMLYEAITPDNVRSMSRSMSRSGVVDSRLILIMILLILSLPLLSISMLPSGTNQIEILSTESPDPNNPSSIAPGSYTESNVTIENNQPIPMVIIVEPASDGLEVFDQVLSAAPGEAVETKFRVWAPEEPGNYIRSRSVHFYIQVLPTTLVAGLHNIHPMIALIVTTGVVLLPIAVVFLLVVGVRKIPLRDMQRSGP